MKIGGRVILSILFGVVIAGRADAGFFDDLTNKIQQGIQQGIDKGIDNGIEQFTHQQEPQNNATPPAAQRPVVNTNQSRYDHAWIREIQQRLAASGFNPGPADGAFGKGTAAAIRAFERAQGMPVTGRPTQSVMQALRAQNQAAAPYGNGSSGAGTASGTPGTTMAVAPSAGGMVAPAPGGGMVAPAPGGGLVASTPGGNMVAPAPGSGMVAPAPGGGMVVPAPGGGMVAPAPGAAAVAVPSGGGALTGVAPPSAGGLQPGNETALAQRYGLRTLLGRPVLADQNAIWDKVLQQRDLTALERFFTLIRLGINPEAGASGGQGANDPALCLANQFLGSAEQAKLLAGGSPKVFWASNAQFRNWKGSGQNEFEAKRSRDAFIKNDLPRIVATAPHLPIEFIYVTRALLQRYDDKRGGFPITGMPDANLNVPRTLCFERVNAAGHLPIAMPFPTFWKLDPRAAEEKVVKRLPVDKRFIGQQRKVYSATVFTLSPAPTARSNAKYQRSPGLVPLAITVKSVALYEDADLERLVHKFEIKTGAAPALTAGIPSVLPRRPVVRLNEETATLVLLKQHGDVLSPSGWARLENIQYQNDRRYFDTLSTQRTNAQRQARGESLLLGTSQEKVDADYVPFFPDGFSFNISEPLSGQQLALFKKWSLKRAQALPDRVVAAASLVGNSRAKSLTLQVGNSIDETRPDKDAAAVIKKGYVPGQIVRPELSGSISQHVSSIGGSSSYGNDTSFVPLLVLPNLLKTYDPQVSMEQLRKLNNAPPNVGLGTPDVAFELAIQKSELLPIQGKRSAFVIYGKPVKMRVLDGDRSRVILERSYNVAALNPNQISTVGKDIVPPKGKTMPFNAEFADLLIAKFQPAALSKPVLERMMLARWYYESSFNGRAGEPDWGRFFVEGKPKPDAAQRAKLLPSFKDWTLRRAAATPSVATVVFRYARLQKPGPMKFGTSLAIGASTLSSASDSCRYGTAAKRGETESQAEMRKNACRYLMAALAMPNKEIYFGSTSYLTPQQRARHLKTGVSLDGSGVGPRLNCGTAISGQDPYCHAELQVLSHELLGQPFEMDDVLVLDKNVIVPDNRPDLTRRNDSNGAIELDVAIVGVQRVNKIPMPEKLTAFERYSEFLVKNGLAQKSGSPTWKKADQESVPLFLFNAQARAARYVIASRDKRVVVADLPLAAPHAPDESLLKAVAPKRIAAPKELFGPDVVGLRLGMRFADADKIIRANMKVGRYLVADRAWQSRAATGQIEPFTSGRLYESQDGSEMIILFDEPPAAKGIVLGLVRQLVLPKGKVPPATVYAGLQKKYGKTDIAFEHSQLWYDGPHAANKQPSYYCYPAENSAGDLRIWRDENSNQVNWKPATVRYSGRTPGLSQTFRNGIGSMTKCGTGMMVTFDQRQNPKWDRLVIRLFNHRLYEQQYLESKRLIETGAPVGESASEQKSVGIKF